MIGPDDIVNYVGQCLIEPPYADYPQTPSYQVSSASRTVWIAHNRSRAKVAEDPARPAMRSLEELRLLYEKAERSRHPCPRADLDCLNWELVAQFAEAIGTPLEPAEPPERAARRLRLYSSLSPEMLHNAAVLCFAREPHALLPQARAIFLRGKRTGRALNRVDVVGPLSLQVEQLTQLRTR